MKGWAVMAVQGPTRLVARRALLREVGEDFFDFPEMARSSLGYQSAIPRRNVSETVEANYATVRSKILTTRGDGDRR